MFDAEQVQTKAHSPHSEQSREPRIGSGWRAHQRDDDRMGRIGQEEMGRMMDSMRRDMDSDHRTARLHGTPDPRRPAEQVPLAQELPVRLSRRYLALAKHSFRRSSSERT